MCTTGALQLSSTYTKIDAILPTFVWADDWLISSDPDSKLSGAVGGMLTIVIKLGTSSILSEVNLQPKLSILSSIVETCSVLKSQGHRVVLVCSGAIGMGKARMGFGKAKVTDIADRQALAALGQLRLIALWDTLFGELGIRVAQVLLTRNDIADRPRYVNARNTLNMLLSPKYNAIPIVNENDTVSVSELRFGDNDTLSAITAGLIDADYLFLLTDVDGLYTGNPRNDPTAKRLGVVENVAKIRKLVDVASQGSSFGTGGMMTKLIAAELAAAAGVATIIINGSTPSNIVKVVEQKVGAGYNTTSLASEQGADGEYTHMVSSVSSLDVEAEMKYLAEASSLEDPPHTLFLPVRYPLKPRKWSILHALHPAGTIFIDEGAYERIRRPESGGRLLAAGVVGVEGIWERMQAVRLVVKKQKRCTSSSEDKAEAVLSEIGRGLANYNSVDCERIRGHKR